MKRPHPALLALAPLSYLLLCVIAAALLAYPLYLLVHEAIGFRSLISRGAMLLIFVGLIPLARRLQLGVTELGSASSVRMFFGQLTRGFGIGVLMLGIHAIILVALDIRLIDQEKLQSLATIMGWLGKALLIGIVVALIEETLFRGVLIGSLGRHTSLVNAALISSFYFAVMHFLRSDMKPEYGSVQWYTGLLIVVDAFRNLGSIQPDAFMALFGAGCFLACVRLVVPRSLGYCMGLHAGWVFVIKTVKPMTSVASQSQWAGMVSSFDGIIGYFSTVWLSALCLLLIALHRNRMTSHAAV